MTDIEQQFTVHFDYYHKETGNFLKRTTLNLSSDSYDSCLISAMKVSSTLLLVHYPKEPWRIEITIADDPITVKIHTKNDSINEVKAVNKEDTQTVKENDF